MELPSFLNQVEFALLRLTLEFQSEAQLPPGFMLRLRRELYQIGRQVHTLQRFNELFAPPLPTDPLLLRGWQKPAPAFVFQPELTSKETLVTAGDELLLPLVLLGRGTPLLSDLLRVFDALGRSGICNGQGPFDLVQVATLDAGGEERCLWRRGERRIELAPNLIEASWWLEQRPVGERCRLSWRTPARLMHAGKPLFRPDFATVLPFLLRRVGAVLGYWCGVDKGYDYGQLQAAGSRLDVLEQALCWRDWRALDSSRDGKQPLGGVCGHLLLSGCDLPALAWVLHFGTLLNVGKGAAYGCGQYCLDFHP